MSYSYFAYLNDSSLPRSKRYIDIYTSNLKIAKERVFGVQVANKESLTFLTRKDDSGMFAKGNEFFIDREWVSYSIFENWLRR